MPIMTGQELQQSKTRIWMGRTLSGLAAAFLLFDATMKFVRPAPVVDAFAHLGLPLSTALPIGVMCLICTVLYAVPQTSAIGAVLLTGYLGGAVATHLRVGDPLFSHVLFPTYMGVMLWAGLFLRDQRLRVLLS